MLSTAIIPAVAAMNITQSSSTQSSDIVSMDGYSVVGEVLGVLTDGSSVVGEIVCV